MNYLKNGHYCIFLYCFWCKLFWNHVFQVLEICNMNHSFAIYETQQWFSFFVRLRFRLLSRCTDPERSPLMWSWSFTLISPSYGVIPIQHLVDFSKSSWFFLSHNKSFIKFSFKYSMGILTFCLSCHLKICQ